MSAPPPPVQFAAHAWFAALASAANNECVEANMSVPGVVGVRDSKMPGTHLAFASEAFVTAVAAVRTGAL